MMIATSNNCMRRKQGEWMSKIADIWRNVNTLSKRLIAGVGHLTIAINFNENTLPHFCFVLGFMSSAFIISRLA